MKTLKELRDNPLKVSSTELAFSRIKDLPNRKIDLNVWLPSIEANLQRGDVWSLHQKRQLIMSIFMDRYIPHLHIMSLVDRTDESTKDDILQVIDGKQRLSAMMGFLDNQFEIIIDDELYYLKDLPKEYQIYFNHYHIKAQIAYEDYNTPFTDKEKIDWFERINFFDTPQDINHLNTLKNSYKTYLNNEKLR
jgi:uncharacterized protein with ParB-like and HNH nuclease domain